MERFIRFPSHTKVVLFFSLLLDCQISRNKENWTLFVEKKEGRSGSAW